MPRNDDGGKGRTHSAEPWNPEKNEDWTWFMILGFVNSKDFHFDQHRSLKTMTHGIGDAVTSALMKNGLRADRFEVVIDDALYTLEYARDLGIEMTIRQWEGDGVIIRFIRRMLLRIYLATGRGLICALDPFSTTDAASKHEIPPEQHRGEPPNGNGRGRA